MVLLHWETLSCLHQHGQGDGQPYTTGRVVQHGRNHGAPQAHGKGWECREALRDGTASNGLNADRAIFESAGAPWQQEIRSVPQRGSCRWTKTPRGVSLASDPLVLPHQRGHEPLPTPKPTRDPGSLHTWCSVTPAMAMATPIMSGRPVHGCPIASRQHAWIDGVPSSTCSCIGINFITAVEGHYLFFPLITIPKFFCCCWGLWGCGQRAALSKRLWSTRRVVHQVRQIHSTASAN
jgi:hypothetical protein